jgi:hypothetical protein
MATAQEGENWSDWNWGMKGRKYWQRGTFDCRRNSAISAKFTYLSSFQSIL